MRGRKPNIPSQATPTSAADSPLPPEWLHEEARAEWDRILNLISSAGAIARPDADVLAAYCETLVMFKQAVAQLHREGLTFENEGMVKRHPSTAIAAECRKDLLRLAAELGMTPISRQRLKVNPGERDELQEFINDGLRIAE